MESAASSASRACHAKTWLDLEEEDSPHSSLPGQNLLCHRRPEVVDRSTWYGSSTTSVWSHVFQDAGGLVPFSKCLNS
jgi:hypothetical protein